jgi:hypothetical protein
MYSVIRVVISLSRKIRLWFSRGRVISDDLLDLLVVSSAVLAEQVVGLGLSRRLGIGLVQQRLDSEKDLFDGDGGLPAFLFVEDGQANSSGRVDVGVEERRNELA